MPGRTVKTLILTVFAVLLAPASAMALRAGDKALNPAPEMFRGNPVSLKPMPEGTPLRVLVIFRGEKNAMRDIAGMLYEQKLLYPEVTFAAITPDPEQQVTDFFGKDAVLPFAVGIDRDGSLVRKYMAGSMLYPAAFAVDKTGFIVWNGEAADLPEMLKSYRNGTFDRGKAIKLAPMLDDLQSRFRRGEEKSADFAVRRILMQDPANGSALRMRIFMLENTGRSQAAWDLLAQSVKKCPAERKLYVMMLDMILRHGGFAGNLKELLSDYQRNVADDPAGDCMMAWRLLTGMQFSSEALAGAGALIQRSANAAGNTLTGVEWHGCAALYAARTGNIAAAVKLQRKMTEMSRQLKLPGAAEAEAMLDYYISIGKMPSLSY